MTAARSVLSVSILALLVFGSAPPTQAAANRINGVSVSKAGDSTVVEIAGERAPNFTTFKQDSPRRVIVDVAECHLGRVPDRIQGDGQLVSAVTTAQYGQAPHGISRVIIGLSSAAEYKVTTRGGSLYVHLTPGAGGLLVSAGVPVAPRRQPNKAPAGKSADLDLPLDVTPPEVADAEHAAPAEPEPVEPEPVEPEPAEPEEPATLAPAEPAPEPPASPEPAPVPSEVRDEEPVRVAMATPPPAAAEPAPAAEPPAAKPVLVAQDEEEVEEIDDEVPVAPAVEDEAGDEPPPPAFEEEEVEPPPPPPPAEEEVEPPPPPPADDNSAFEDIPPPPEDEGGFEDVPPPSDEGVEDVPPPPPADSAVEDVPVAPGYDGGSGERIEVSGALKDMTWVGFQQTLESSRVFIKTTEPVRFHVTEEGDNLVVLELENTRIPLRNNTRFLDTHFFDSAVTMITPREIEGVSRNVRIEIQLRNKVPFSSGQDENMVFLDFSRP